MHIVQAMQPLQLNAKNRWLQLTTMFRQLQI